MNRIPDLAKTIEYLPIPEPSEHDFQTEIGVEKYRSCWSKLMEITDKQVKEVIRAKASGIYKGKQSAATKVIKHLEKWREHSLATTELWDRTWKFRAVSENRDALDDFYAWLEVKTSKESWLLEEERALKKLNTRLGKSHTKLLREHELLQVELEAV